MKGNKTKKFSGLSSPEDLIEMWRELRYDDDDKDINVIWDYTSPKQLKEGFNIVNIKYSPDKPDAIGHYVLISNLGNEIEYFNPVASHTSDDLDKLKELKRFAEENGFNTAVDLTGKQREESENCGYHCLTHAYNLYKKSEKKGGADSLNNDKMDTLIKSVRGIYFGLKYGFDKQTPHTRKKGSGIADYGKEKYTYSSLKDEVES